MSAPIPTRHLHLIFDRDRLCREYDRRVDLYNSLSEHRRIAAVIRDTERDLRIMRWQSRIKAFCIAVAVGCIVYFGGQLVRPTLYALAWAVGCFA